MLTQLLTYLKETPSAVSGDHEAMPPEPVRLKRDRTIWERAMGIFPEETEAEKT